MRFCIIFLGRKEMKVVRDFLTSLKGQDSFKVSPAVYDIDDIEQQYDLEI